MFRTRFSNIQLVIAGLIQLYANATDMVTRNAIIFTLLQCIALHYAALRISSDFVIRKHYGRNHNAPTYLAGDFSDTIRI